MKHYDFQPEGYQCGRFNYSKYLIVPFVCGILEFSFVPLTMFVGVESGVST
jgi:hypothetical protein